MVHFDNLRVLSAHDQQRGALTWPSCAPTRAGRPPSDATAPIRGPSSAAATSAVPLPVPAPNQPIGRAATSGSALL